MSYEKTVWAGEGTLAREQEYNYHWCYERGIITKAWLDVYAATATAASTTRPRRTWINT